MQTPFLVVYAYRNEAGDVCDDASEFATESEARAFFETCPDWQRELWNQETGQQLA